MKHDNYKPLVSIIIPVYNTPPQYFKKCLNSILSQSYQKTEIIIINDGSSDTKTINGLRQYKNKKIQLINTTNKGVSHARNIGLNLAKGDYVTFVDSDDLINKNTIKVLIDLATKNFYPDFLRYNFTSTNKKYNNDLGVLKNKTLNLEQERKLLVEYFYTGAHRIPTYTPLLFIRKDIYKQLHFDEEISYLEDTLFYTDLFCIARTAMFVDKKLYCYMDTNGSVSRNPKNIPLKVYNMIHVCEKILGMNFFSKKEKAKIIENILRLMASFLIMFGIHDYCKYKILVKELHNYNNFRKVYNCSDKQSNIAKKIYLRLIYAGLPAITVPFLILSKKRYR